MVTVLLVGCSIVEDILNVEIFKELELNFSQAMTYYREYLLIWYTAGLRAED